MTFLISEKRPVARKQHRCQNCNHMISVGTQYLKQFCIDGGDTWSWVSHQDCHAAALKQHRIDGGDYYDGVAPLIEYENSTGEFPDWLRGEFPHVICRLEFWKQVRNEGGQ